MGEMSTYELQSIKREWAVFRADARLEVMIKIT